MTAKPMEIEFLTAAEKALTIAVGGKYGAQSFEFRLQILEAAAARFGGFELGEFHNTFGTLSKKSACELLELAAPVAAAIEHSSIPPSLALSILAREVLQEHDRKSTGAYHTDFRLAIRLAQLAAPALTYKSKVIDPACGAGILLAALTLAVCGADRAKTAYWIANCVFAADLSANSLRATLLCLASFTDDIRALKSMRDKWFCGDSLLADQSVWSRMTTCGFDAVIGNPPWEKVKLSRHEFLKSSGQQRHYGSEISSLDEASYVSKRDEVLGYSQHLLVRYPDLGKGEPDLYIAFTELFFNLCRSGGIVAALLPGGLIRSQGTQTIRQKIFETSQSISFSIFDNRARFFSIDTRFKFLALVAEKSASGLSKRKPVQLLHERGTPSGTEITGSAVIGRAALSSLRSDLSVPEVRSLAEWKLYSKISKAGVDWNSQYGWTAKFCREVDMTKDRPKFLPRSMVGAFPLVEGRMVQAHRFGVKGYVAGSGRSALWKAFAIGDSKLSPQFWIHPSNLSESARMRANTLRAGFCDIAGQTNERSLMASLIPAGVVCGNKVPTIVFHDDPSEERLYVWTAVANSFVFDWMLRRVLTTTVNYFLLQSVALPKLARNGLPWKKLVNAARRLRALDNSGSCLESCELISLLRAEIDAEIAVAYGLDLVDMELILQDFPILDRGQVALPGEGGSTITKDTVLAAVAKRTGSRAAFWARRAAAARALGANAYVPSELALSGEGFNEKETHQHG